MTSSPTPRIALITGGSRGLGRNGALKLAQRGVDVVITYRSQHAEADQVVAEIAKLGRRAVALQLDVGVSSSFPAFAQTLRETLKQNWQREQFDILLNNAGIGGRSSLAETTEAQFDELMRIHLKGPFFLTQALLPLISDGARIINVSSGLARFTIPGAGTYAIMKGGVEVMTRYMAKEFAARGITVNTLAPGAIATDFGGGAVRDNPEMNKFVASVTALGRAGLPDDIGDVIALLASPESHWITAQRIEASGGMFV